MTHIGGIFMRFLLQLVKGDKRSTKKIPYFLLYIKYVIKYAFFWKILRIPLHSESLPAYKLHFFHYSIFLSLFEDLFLNEEYFVNLPHNPTIIDLGSEVGMSVFYFKSIYPNARIQAYEPDPSSYSLLTRNCTENMLTKIDIHNVALSNSRGHAPFFIDPEVDGSLTMSLNSKRQKKRIMVNVDRLSRLITRKVDLLKMDIEGAELEVLRDLSQSKKLQLIDMLIIEYHHHINIKENTLSHLLRLLEINKFGYQIKAHLSTPFSKRTYQDFLIFAYRE